MLVIMLIITPYMVNIFANALKERYIQNSRENPTILIEILKTRKNIKKHILFAMYFCAF